MFDNVVSAQQDEKVVTRCLTVELRTNEENRARTPSQIRTRYYRPELDALRCLAFALVFCYHLLDPSLRPHFRFYQAGSAGVCLFFFLSAFLITELLMREREATGTVHMKAFYWRRVLRIWPLYSVGLLLALLLPYINHKLDHVGRFIPAYLLMCGNWAVANNGAWFHNPAINPLWSISVEEQFYLLWPLIVKRFDRRGLICLSLIILLSAWAVDYVFPLVGVAKVPGLWVNSVSQFQFFALGALMAVATHHKRMVLSRWLRLGMLVFGLMLLMFAAMATELFQTTKVRYPGEVALGYCLIDASCILIFLAFYMATLPSWCAPAVYLGKISYGLYIFHSTVMAVTAKILFKPNQVLGISQRITLFASTAVLVVCVASGMYYWVEKPFLRLKGKFAFLPTRLP